MKKKAFTLIELIAVLVILAILALIVTPLVMNIIRKAKISADKRSIDAYGRSVELAIASYLLDNGKFPTELNSLNVEYTGKEVNCNVMQMKENGGIYLSECTVGVKQIKDSSSDDGWYHYGTRDITDKEYVDMYGYALQTASVAYYNSNHIKVSDYRSLSVNYTGKKVSCDVYINSDGTVYLSNCAVDGVLITDDTEDGTYHYGNPHYNSYSLGSIINYNNVSYYVLKESSVSEHYVTLLKAEPLTVDEVNTYGGAGTENNYINRGMPNTNGTAVRLRIPGGGYSDYGGVTYYSSDTCHADEDDNDITPTGCIADYNESDIKHIVDAWAEDKIEEKYLKEARLIKVDEVEMQSVQRDGCGHGCWYTSTGIKHNWVYSNQYEYWTMSLADSTTTPIYVVADCDDFLKKGTSFSDNNGFGYYNYYAAVRPVIVLSKSAL